jgi:plasmid stabilization system protein ParE
MSTRWHAAGTPGRCREARTTWSLARRYLYRTEEEGEIRVLLHGHYRIAHQVQQQRVVVLGVFHAALDIVRLLGPAD